MADPMNIRADIIRRCPPLFLFLSIFFVLPYVFAAQSISNQPVISISANANDFIHQKASVRHCIEWSSDEFWEMTLCNSMAALQGNGLSSKSVEGIEWKISTSDKWLPLSYTESVICSGPKGSGLIYLDFHVLLSWSTAEPGRYGSTINFKIRPAEPIATSNDNSKSLKKCLELLKLHTNNHPSKAIITKIKHKASSGGI
jgi:hypothetical protein